MLVHEVKHANFNHIAKSKLQFMAPILEILLLIQLQGGNYLADLTPKTVWAEKLGTFFFKTWNCSSLPSIQHLTALPYLYVQSFPLKLVM